MVWLLWGSASVQVKVDDREEKVPLTQLEHSAIYQEALGRLTPEQRPKFTKVRWSRILSNWIPLNIFVWWLLFRASKKKETELWLR